jgi:mercuric reductase
MNKTSHSPGPENGRYDLAVIGAGSAGFSAAITAAETGAKVVLIGYGTIGGTCVNVGCVPSKAMIRAVEILHQARTASRFAGIKAEAHIEDWPALEAQKDDLVAQLRQAKYIDLLPSYDNVTYLEGAARLTKDGIAVGGNDVKAGKIIIATGSSPSLPDIPGIKDVPHLNSTQALELKAPPKSLMVIGGGYIGCELAQMFARAGVEITIVCRSRLLPGAEPEIGAALTGYLRDEGISVRGGLTYKQIRRTGKGIALDVDEGGGQTAIEAEQLLITTGRRPNTDGMGLKEAGVALLANGGVKVDELMRTTREGVYAAGDVTGRDMFVYMAAYGAKIAAANAMNGDAMRYDNTAMPWVVFTDPQVAGVGLSEAAAGKRGIEVKTSILALENVPRALAARDTRGLIKLVADAASNKLIGAQIMAPEGAESIQTAVLAIKGGMTVSELGQTIFPYLTTVEGLKLAALTFDKDIGKLSCCAG